MILNQVFPAHRTYSRLVSLVPSQTELLWYLGLEEEVVGITKFCVHPDAWFRNKTRVGGTKSIHEKLIRGLCPDLIIANREENVKEQIESLSADFDICVTDVHDLAGALDMIRDTGILTGKTGPADRLADRIREGFEGLREALSCRPVLRAAYLVWQDPYMAAGGDSFISDMMARCHLENIFSNRQRYPAVTPEEIAAAGCELLLLSSEPFPFTQKHAAAIEKKLPGIRVVLADGEMFSWYGSRLLQSVDYFHAFVSDL
jgi:ABC-type Fe3+-hydroxamate transport system substrate-binding protein